MPPAWHSICMTFVINIINYIYNYYKDNKTIQLLHKLMINIDEYQSQAKNLRLV